MKMVVPFLLDARKGGWDLRPGRSAGSITMGIIGLTCGGLLGGMVASRYGLKAWLWVMVCMIHAGRDLHLPRLRATGQSGHRHRVHRAGTIRLRLRLHGLHALHDLHRARQTSDRALRHLHRFHGVGHDDSRHVERLVAEIIGYQHFFLWVILATIPSFLVVLLVPLDKEFGKKA